MSTEQPTLDVLKDAEFKPADVKAAAGLSYKVLNDWERKGVFPTDKGRGAGWRKFTLREVFALMVCSEIRQRFGVPVESLRWIKAFMLKEGANHFNYAVETIDKYGFAVWLLTDLKETFIMDTDLEMEELLHLGFLRGASPKGFILLSINPLVNRLLQCHKPPIKLKIQDRIYVKLRAINSEDMQNTIRQNVRFVRKSAVQFKKSSRQGIGRVNDAGRKGAVGRLASQHAKAMDKPRSSGITAPSVEQPGVRSKSRRRIANADVRTMQTNLGR
jgi:hypothetical protein